MHDTGYRVSSRHTPASGLLALALVLCTAADAQQRANELARVDVVGTTHQLNAPPGTRIEKLANLDAPRLMHIGRDGEMFIGSRADRIYRLAPPYEDAEMLVELGGYPHSVVQRGNQLYVATTDGLLRAEYQAGDSLSSDNFTQVARLPGGSGHSSRSLSLGPDDRLYVSLGIQGNCSDQHIGEGYDFEDRRGGIMVLDDSGDSAQWQPYTTGLRNPVGLAWDHAGTLYATNNGPDHWGYDEPREVLVRAEPGSFHGMPWFQWVDGEPWRDDCVDSEPPREASEIPAPVATLPARSAPMGLAFLPPGNGLALDTIVAVHGSWATQPDGGASGDPATRREPKVVGITLDEQGRGEVRELLTGFQNSQGQRWARPVGVSVAPDGALYFTSDTGESGLYRVTFDEGPIGADTTLDQAAQANE